jgi:hypothetical protein
MRRFRLHLVLLSLSVGVQAQIPASDPQALALAAQSVSAMTGGTTISDVTLTGTAVRTVGSEQQSGTATLLGKGFAESRFDLQFPEGSRSEIRNTISNLNVGNWIGSDSTINAIALHNCFTDANWFFPALGSLAYSGTNSNLVLGYVGLEDLGSGTFQHVQAYTYNPDLPDAQTLSIVDFYLDPQSLLPVALLFNEHPDTDQTIKIPVQVWFSDYRSFGGALIPFRVQRYVNNNLVLDIQVGTVSLNSNISDDNFSIQ